MWGWAIGAAVSGAVGQGLDNRGTALGLNADHARPPGADPAQPFHLVKGFPHADESGPAAGRVDDDIRELPVELLGQFIAHGFFALDPVGLFERRDIEPALPVLTFGHHPAAVGDEAVNQGHPGAVVLTLQTVGQRHVARHEDMGFQPGPGGVGGQRAGRVAGRGNGQFFHPEFFGHGHGHGHAAGLERGGRVERFVFDVQPRQPELAAQARAWRSGVQPSPRLMTFSACSTGKTSR